MFVYLTIQIQYNAQYQKKKKKSIHDTIHILITMIGSEFVWGWVHDNDVLGWMVVMVELKFFSRWCKINISIYLSILYYI